MSARASITVRKVHKWFGHVVLWLALAAAVAVGIATPALQAQGAPLAAPPATTTAAQPSAVASWLPPGSMAGEAPSVAVYPPQALPLRFDHRKHVQMQLACIDCHSAAQSSASASDKLLPAPTKCDSCHGSSHANLSAVTPGAGAFGACATCHEGYAAGDANLVKRVHIPNANLIFPHNLHNARNIGCAQCHGNVEEVAKATREQLPRMQTCLRCHTGEGPTPPSTSARVAALQANGKAQLARAPTVISRTPQGSCETCHLRAENQPGSLIRTEFPSGKMLPPKWMHNAAHDARFLERHKFVAGDDARFCATCHKEDECVACHDGRVRPRNIHPNDYLSMHAIEARQLTQKCQSCHREQSFCVGCHQRLGLAVSSPLGVREQTRFHPPKQIFSDLPRKPGHHAEQAVRNLEACVSCHVERDCTSCHAAAGIGAGFNPHPPGFAARCQSMLSRNPRPCLVCHESRTEALDRCR